MLGEFATSKAGHDKDRLYMIVGEEEEWVYLCDGRLRGVEHPKKKKKKHIQIIHSSGRGCVDTKHATEPSGGERRDQQTNL